MDNDELVHGTDMSLTAASMVAPSLSIHGAVVISAAITPPAADGTTETTASATDAGMVADTGAAADDTHAPGASGTDADMAIDIATDVTTSRCAVITGGVADDTMATDGPEPLQLPLPTEQNHLGQWRRKRK